MLPRTNPDPRDARGQEPSGRGNVDELVDDESSQGEELSSDELEEPMEEVRLWAQSVAVEGCQGSAPDIWMSSD